MAILKYGIDGPVTGKIGNLVYYFSNGKNIVRRNGVNLHPPTVGQLTSRLGIAVMSRFLSSVLEFVNIGYEVKGKADEKKAYNRAMSYNKKNALTGVYPDIVVNYEQVQLSEGNADPALNPSVTLTADGLWFEWTTFAEMSWPERTDQAMLMAYFPILEKAVFLLYGPARIDGAALLDISAPMQTEYMETYISFVSADRKSVSNSIYTGSFNK